MVFFFKNKHVFGKTSNVVIRDTAESILTSCVIGYIMNQYTETKVDNWYVECCPTSFNAYTHHYLARYTYQ